MNQLPEFASLKTAMAAAIKVGDYPQSNIGVRSALADAVKVLASGTLAQRRQKLLPSMSQSRELILLRFSPL